MHHSIVIEESLKDKSALDKYKILRTKVSEDWHLRVIEVTDVDGFITTIKNAMVTDKPYYFHTFDDGKELIIAFREKVFKIDPNDKNTWFEAQKYGGEKLGIPGEQLDFAPSNFADEDRWYESD